MTSSSPLRAPSAAPGSSRAWRRLGLSSVLFALAASCSPQQSCLGGAPAGPSLGAQFPGKARNDGAIQVRVSETGLTFAQDSLAPALLEQVGPALNTCIPGGGSGFVVGGYQYCTGVCQDGSEGCAIDVQVEGFEIDAQEPDLMTLSVVFRSVDALLDAEAYVGNPPIAFDIINCDAHVFTESFPVRVPVRFVIEPGTGYLAPEIGAPDFDLGAIHFDLSGDLLCRGVNAVLNADFVRNVLFQLVTPVVEQAVGVFANSMLCLPCDADGACPAAATCVNGTCMRGLDCLTRPLGMEGSFEPASLLGDFLRPDSLPIDYLGVAGGFALVEQGGLSLGVTAGVFSESHPGLRVAQEPPANPIPRAAALAGNLTPEGQPFEVALGIHEWALRRALWAVYESGTLLIQVDSSLSSFLSTNNVAMLVGSLRELTGGVDRPLLLTLAPAGPPDLELGAGTLAPDPANEGQFVIEDPLVTLRFEDLSLDLYTLVHGQNVRFLRMTLDLVLPLALEFTPNNELLPVLDAATFTDALRDSVVVTDSELLTEDPSQLAALLPTLLSIGLPLLMDSLVQPLALPTFQGFTLDMREGMATGVEDGEILALFAGLDYQAPPPAEPEPAPEARLLPQPPLVPGTPAELILAVDDARAEELELQWRVDGGFWSPFARSRRLKVRSPLLTLPGQHRVELRARRRGDYRSLSASRVLTVALERPTPALAAVPAAPAPRPAATPTIEVQRGLLEPGADEGAGAGASDLGGDPLAGGCSVAGTAHAGAGWGLLGLLALGFVALRGRRRQGLRLGLLLLGAVALLAACDSDSPPAADGQPSADLGPAQEDLGPAEGEGEGEGEDCPEGCPEGQSCVEGRCEPLAPVCPESCPEGQVCCTNQGRCVEPRPAACAGDSCEPGYRVVIEERGAFDVEACEWLGLVCGCEELPPLAEGDVGSHAAIAYRDGLVAVAAYDSTYGDLILGSTHPDDRLEGFRWQLVDGLPEDAPIEGAPSGYRGGIKRPGPDVGRYPAVALGAEGLLHLAYYDATSLDLRYALGRPQDDGSYAFDTYTLESEGDVGAFVRLQLDAEGRPALAYRFRGTMAGGARVTALRVATSASASPAGPAAWTFREVEQAPLAGNVAGPEGLPPGLGVGIALARHADGRLVVAYYDSGPGALHLARETAPGQFGAPVVVAGEGEGKAFDQGSYPSLAIDAADREHLVYMDAGRGQLLYLQPEAELRQVVDDGVRQRADGSVSLQRVGAGAKILFDNEEAVRVFYQDSSSLDLVESLPLPAGDWRHLVLAGGGEVYQGAFGFAIDAVRTDAGHAIISYRMDRQAQPPRNNLHLLLR